MKLISLLISGKEGNVMKYIVRLKSKADIYRRSIINGKTNFNNVLVWMNGCSTFREIYRVTGGSMIGVICWFSELYLHRRVSDEQKKFGFYLIKTVDLAAMFSSQSKFSRSFSLHVIEGRVSNYILARSHSRSAQNKASTSNIFTF